MIPHAKPPQKMTPKQEYLYGVGTTRHAARAVHRYTLALRWFKANAPESTALVDSASAFAFNSAWAHARGELRAHRWLLKFGRRVEAEGWKRLHPLPPIPHRSGWLCIHGYEGAWDDSGDPYWGGLQMDRGFMRTYGSDYIARFGGYADVWPVWAQMAAAERAYAGYDWRGLYVGKRGYSPWPNTARYCHLL